MRHSHDFEVIIIGASVTGASLAHALGSAGIKTALIDKQYFPRRKPCGEGLGAFAAEPLTKLGLSDAFETAKKVQLKSYNLNFSSFSLPIPIFGTSNGSSFGIDRCIFDNFLFTRASSHSTVETIMGQRVSKIEQASSTVWVDSTPLKGRFIILASGLNSLFKENITYSKGFDRYGVSLHATTFSPHNLNSVEIFLFPQFQIFVTPIDSNHLNISALGTASAIKNIAALDMNPVINLLSEQLNLKITPTTTILGAGPFGRKASRRILGNIILAGDAYESLDPIGGMGMTQGLITAQYLGAALIDILKFDQVAESRLAIYGQKILRSIFPLKLLTEGVNFGLTKILCPFNQKLRTEGLPISIPVA